ncbi:potassium channel family protein [Natronomonas amylolytica]|uniref:potassium channel family protein n=1 Tax=Natronomonas amylolytica TaxID=3108498 RepID=UPI00300A464F
MRRIRRRAAYYILFISVLIVVSAMLYDVGMRTFEPGPYPPEGTSISLLHSMQVVVETFTATGYGSDSPWQSPQMNVLVMLLDITGVGLFFLALPAVLLPLFQEALSPSLPTAVDEGLSDHVVVCADTTRSEAAIDELQANGVGYVLVVPDRERATDLRNDGYDVIHGDPEDIETLADANLPDARALVADVSDRVDASIVLTAKELVDDVEIISVVEDPDVAAYHRLAGADHVLTPRQLLGRSLAEKITTAVRTDLGEDVQLGEEIEIAEVPVRQGSDLVGRSIADSNLRERYGVNVIGTWVRGEFETPPPAEKPLERGTILLVVGGRTGLERLKEAAFSTVRRFRKGKTVLVGYGEVGQTVAERLSEADIPHTIVDRRDHDAVDIVGDATDPETLKRAGLARARSVVFALPDDTTTEFATLVVRDLDSSVEVIARAEKTRAVAKTYRAGADYVLSLATVSGRSIATRLINDEEILSLGTNVEIVRTTAPELTGETLREARIRERTGCTVVGIERDDEVVTDIDPDMRFGPDDAVVIVGTDDGTNRFAELFG